MNMKRTIAPGKSSERRAVPNLEDTISKVEFMLFALLEIAAHTDQSVPEDRVICGAFKIANDLIADLRQILAAHSTL